MKNSFDSLKVTSNIFPRNCNLLGEVGIFFLTICYRVHWLADVYPTWVPLHDFIFVLDVLSAAVEEALRVKVMTRDATVCYGARICGTVRGCCPRLKMQLSDSIRKRSEEYTLAVSYAVHSCLLITSSTGLHCLKGPGITKEAGVRESMLNCWFILSTLPGCLRYGGKFSVS